MSGLLALLDDVAAIAKVAASSVDDIATAAAKAGSKTAMVAIDDAAVTPKYVVGFSAERELPIIWKIARGSLFNKLVVLLPAALLLASFAPGLIQPLLMLGGAYLCFEGAEKLYHAWVPHGDDAAESSAQGHDPAHLEETKVAGAVKTDFILSAEIMAIALSTVAGGSLWAQTATLALIGVGMTALVYGGVAVLVKLDDIGLHLARTGRWSPTRQLGKGMVWFMPVLMQVLSVVGTAAMLWVGGSIMLHGLEVTHLWAAPYLAVHHVAEAAGQAVPAAAGVVAWAVGATLDGVVGLAIGLTLIPLVTKVLGPAVQRLKGARPAQ